MTILTAETGTGTTTGGGTHDVGTAAPISATPANTSDFTGWSGTGCPIGTTSPTTVVVNANTICTATFTLKSTNSPPTAVNDRYQIRKNTVLRVKAPGVLANDSDPIGNRLRAMLVSTVSHGRLTFNANGSFSYEPSRNFIGTDHFTYKASNTDGLTDEATVRISVTRHFDRDGCDHDRHRNRHHDRDDCDHERETRHDDDDRNRRN